MYKIFIIGQTAPFYSSLEHDLNDKYSSLTNGKTKVSFEYGLHENITQESSVKKLLENNYDVIIFDTQIPQEKVTIVSTLLVSILTNTSPLLISLLNAEQEYENIERSVLHNRCTYFFKSFDNLDIINYICTSISPEISKRNDLATVIYTDFFKVYELAKINLITREHVAFETKTKLSSDLHNINLPFLVEELHANKHFVNDKCISGSSIHSDFTYELTFNHFSAPIKKSMLKALEDDLQRKAYAGKISPSVCRGLNDIKRNSSIVIATDNDEKKKTIKKDDDIYLYSPPENLINYSKSILANWINSRTNKDDSCELSIIIYDANLNLIGDFLEGHFDKYSRVILKMDCENIEEDIKKHKPTLLTFQIDDKITLLSVTRGIQSLVKFRNYLPYILIFNNPIKNVIEFQNQLEYHFLISVGDKINSAFIDKILNLYKKKVIEQEDNKAKRLLSKVTKSIGEIEIDADDLFQYKLFPPYKDFNDYFLIEEEIEIIALTETEILFKMNNPPEIGRCFKVIKPIEMYLKVMPHRKASTEHEIQNTAKASITMLREVDKERIRRFINSVCNLDQNNKLFEKELLALKKEYFPEHH